MFAGTGAPHRERPHHHPFMQLLRSFMLFGIILIHQQYQVKISVAHMAYDRRDQIGFTDVVLGLTNAFSKL